MAPATRSSDNKGDAGAGTKHQTDQKSSPAPKRAKKSSVEKHQKTIEETQPNLTSTVDIKDEVETTSKEEQPKTEAKDVKNGSAEKPQTRNGATSSSILEKGIIYFFFRGRVGIDEPSSVEEIARSFIVLRPIGKDAELGEGTIGDVGNSRLIAIPKKVLPSSGKDRWIAFVEKSHTTFQTLKEEFLSSSDYVTKTVGTRHSPAATPIGEGIYAITTTGRESHLAYMLTLPSTLGEVQEEIGLRERGSFILSTRNPEYKAPANARLPKGPEYPEEIKEEFRALRWIPTKPKHLDYPNTQFLLIGESSGLEKATETQEKDQKEGKNEPLEELEKLEDEDTQRMEGLKGSDSMSIFADLEVNAKDYPQLQTTF